MERLTTDRLTFPTDYPYLKQVSFYAEWHKA